MAKENGLPNNFNERWGAMEEKVGYMKAKLDKVEPADIMNLKQDMLIVKRAGAVVFGGIIISLSWAWRKLLNGGN